MSPLELEFLSGLLNMDPKKRLTGEECLRHPYFASLAETDIFSSKLTPSRGRSLSRDSSGSEDENNSNVAC